MPISRSASPWVAVTLGDAAGVGPEVTVKALKKLRSSFPSRVLILGPARLFNSLAARISSGLRFRDIGDLDDCRDGSRQIPCYFPYPFPASIARGRYDKRLSAAAMRSIRLGADLAKRRKIGALVTAPVNKASLKKAGFNISGHTEYLARLSGTKRFEMMLVGGPLRVVLVTRHLALSKVSARISARRVEEAILLTDKELRSKFGIARPRLAVCALNPHAGENGHFGTEEIRRIAPGVARAKKKTNAGIVGPLPADVLFHDAYLGRYDAQICMYHDQGLIPLKMISRGSGVNVTLGLPFIRTSPDHGTGYDIAARLIADPGSMIGALRLAAKLCGHA